MKNVLGSGVAATMVIGGLSIAAPANAGDFLWDQPPIPSDLAFIDQYFSDTPTATTFLVHDVVIATLPVEVQSVTTYFTNWNGSWPQNLPGTAVLNIFADPLGIQDDPLLGQAVSVDYATSADGLTISVTASGLGEVLTPGTYWIGLTPMLDFGGNGQEFHLEAALVGANTQARNPGEGFGHGTDWFEAGPTFGGLDVWDGAIRIEGEVVPAPGAVAGLGIAALAGRRRRRRK